MKRTTGLGGYGLRERKRFCEPEISATISIVCAAEPVFQSSGQESVWLSDVWPDDFILLIAMSGQEFWVSAAYS